MAMREVFSRIQEVAGRIEDLNDDGIDEFLNLLSRIEWCKEKMVLMFLNKKRDDGVWEAIEEAKGKTKAEKHRRENSKIVPVIVERTKPRVSRWLDVEWNKKNLTVSSPNTIVVASSTSTLPPLIEI